MKEATRVGLFLLLFVVMSVITADFVRRDFAPATSNSIVYDKTVCTGTVAAGGGTATCTYGITTDTAVHIIADVGLSQLDAGHLWGAANFGCDAIFENYNGTMGTATALTASPNTAANPMAAIGTSTTTPYARTGRAEGSDGLFVNGGSGIPPNCSWSTNASHQAVLTITNEGSSGGTADFTAYITTFNFGSH